MNVDIICMGNIRVGYGHIKRSQTLARALQKRGINPNLIDISDLLQSNQDKKYSGDCDFQIIDVPTEEYYKVTKFLCEKSKKISLDYFGDDKATTRINIFDHIKIETPKKYVGYEYIIMRDDFVRPIKIINPHPKIVKKNALIMIGGADINQQGVKAAEILTKLGVNVILVRGPLTKRIRPTADYKILRNPNNLYKLILEAQLMVVNGGGSLFEALYLRKPAIVLPQTWEEKNIAKDLLSRKQILGLGFNELRKISWSRVSKISKAIDGKIDSNGANRIIDLIFNIKARNE